MPRPRAFRPTHRPYVPSAFCRSTAALPTKSWSPFTTQSYCVSTVLRSPWKSWPARRNAFSSRSVPRAGARGGRVEFLPRLEDRAVHLHGVLVRADELEPGLARVPRRLDLAGDAHLFAVHRPHLLQRADIGLCQLGDKVWRLGALHG